MAVGKILYRIHGSDVVFCWFASVYAFVGVALAGLLGLKSIVVVGGVDAAKDRELDYGIWLNPFKARLVRYVFLHADKILVVDPCLKEEAVRLAGYEGKNISWLPTGYDSNFWKPVGEKEPFVLTVAVVRDERTMRLKGIDLLAEVARILPAVQFVVIGIDPALALKLRPPPNMKFQDYIPRKEILPFYQRAKVYCQPSRREGLPNALCEAMLCGCISVAAQVGGIPTAVGDAGLLVPSCDAGAFAEAVMKAFSLGEDVAGRARARIVSLFPKEKRENGLLRIIREAAR